MHASQFVMRGACSSIKHVLRSPRLGEISTVRRGDMRCMFATGGVFDKIAEEHRKVENMYKEFKQPSTTQDRQQMLAWEIIRELAVHSAKEEMVVYPALREKVGDAPADQALAEHQQLKEVLSDLDAMKITDPDFKTKMKQMMDALMHHVKEEENDIYPQLAKAQGVTEEYLNGLAMQYERAQAIAPTRPHPSAPNKPPLNVAANMTTMPLDAARDTARFGVSGPPDA